MTVYCIACNHKLVKVGDDLMACPICSASHSISEWDLMVQRAIEHHEEVQEEWARLGDGPIRILGIAEPEAV